MIAFLLATNLFGCRTSQPDNAATVCGDIYEERRHNEPLSVGPTPAEIAAPLDTLAFDAPEGSPFRDADVTVDVATASAWLFTSASADCDGHYQLGVTVQGMLTTQTEGPLDVTLFYSRHDLPEDVDSPGAFGINVRSESAFVPSDELATRVSIGLGRVIEEVQSVRLEAGWAPDDEAQLMAHAVFLQPGDDTSISAIVALEGEMQLDPVLFWPFEL